MFNNDASKAKEESIASMVGLENPVFLECRRVAVTVAELQHNVEQSPVEVQDEAVVRALCRGL